jgi:uncharacterized Zn-binding protein involved in type VI secretion
VIITASSDVLANDIGVARQGDLHSCPIPGHGITAITTGSPDTDANGQPVARIGDTCGCGATLVSGSPDTFCN